MLQAREITKWFGDVQVLDRINLTLNRGDRAGLIGPNLAKQIVKTWLSTDFGGGRHQPRIDKIIGIEKYYMKAGK
jgi:ABC-type hemin transport system ATPase subunit